MYLLLMRHWITDVVVVFVQLWTVRWCRYILLWFWWWTHNDTFSICTWLLLWYLSDFKHLHNFTHAPCTSVHTDSWWFWHLCQRNAHSYYNETAVKCVNDCLWPWEYKPFVSHTHSKFQQFFLDPMNCTMNCMRWWLFNTGFYHEFQMMHHYGFDEFSSFHIYFQKVPFIIFFLLYFYYDLLYSPLCCSLKAKAFTSPSNIHDIY